MNDPETGTHTNNCQNRRGEYSAEEVAQMSMKITHSTVVIKTIVIKFFSITALTTTTRRTRDKQHATRI